MKAMFYVCMTIMFILLIVIAGIENPAPGQAPKTTPSGNAAMDEAMKSMGK